MQELHRAQAIVVPEKERDAIVEAYTEQLAAWGVAVPDVPPLVLDFGLGRFAEVGLVEAWICNEVTAGYCGKYLFLFDGQTCPMHRHREKTETFFVVKGAVEVSYDDTVRQMQEGDTLLVTPWKPHSLTGMGPALILEVSTPCQVDDNYFQNPDIPLGGNYGGGVL